MKLGLRGVGLKWRTKIKSMPTRKKWILGAALVSVIALGIFMATRGEQPLLVQMMDLKLEDIERNVVSNGRLEAATRQDFFTPVDSTLMELKVKAGDRVKKGDVLGRLDSLELARKYKNSLAVLAARQAELAKAEAVSDELNLQEAEAQYQKAQNHLERIEQLYKAGAVNIEEQESARVEEAKAKALYNGAKVKMEQQAGSRDKASLKAQVELAQQEVDQAKERMDLATFVAAFDGVVTVVNAKEGNRVLEGTQVMEVGNEDVLEVTATVNEIDAGSLEIGQDVKISCLALPGREFHGEVSRVGAAAIIQKTNSGDTVNVPVTIKLKGKTGELKIGYTVDLTISLQKESKVLAIPVEAIMERDGKKSVFLVQNGVAREQQVKTRMGNELKDVLTSGLKAGDKVVLNPPSNLKPGQKVMAMPAGAANDQNI
ncbi:MAG: efflux RND transporter periplasmic adaptor subunit [Syntrophomonadaceae bacterium]|nr:efflux RND transporter periplasmic adaptor subunit [Syntrophomonadaceae bacterium]